MYRIKKFDLTQMPRHLWESIYSDENILKSRTPRDFRDRLLTDGIADPSNLFAEDLIRQKENPIPNNEVLGFSISNQHPLYSWMLLNENYKLGNQVPVSSSHR